MANFNSRVSVFQIHDGTSLRDISASIVDLSVRKGRDLIEVTALGDAARSYIDGLSNTTISLTLLYDDTSSTGSQPVFDLLDDDDTVRAWDYGPEGSTGGFPKYSGNCLVTMVEDRSVVGNRVERVVEIQVDGAVTTGTY